MSTADYRECTIEVESGELVDADDGTGKVHVFKVYDEEVGRVPARLVVLRPSPPKR